MCIDARTHRTALTKGEFYEKKNFGYIDDSGSGNSRAFCCYYAYW